MCDEVQTKFDVDDDFLKALENDENVKIINVEE